MSTKTRMLLRLAKLPLPEKIQEHLCAAAEAEILRTKQDILKLNWRIASVEQYLEKLKEN